VNGCIYVIDGDYSWTSDYSGVYALGTGSFYVLGVATVMLANKKNLSFAQIKIILMKCMRIASSFDPYTGPPFYTHTQEEEK
jgi:hypothetical protein